MSIVLGILAFILMIVLFVVEIVVCLVGIAALIALYVLEAMGMQKIAARRGLKCPWLAWIPVGKYWVLGDIADDYRVKMGGKPFKYGIWMLIAYVAYLVFTILYTVVVVIAYFVWPLWIVAILLLIPMYIGYIAFSVFFNMAGYSVYRSCKPEKATLYLMLSIFLGLNPVFLFLCRDSDEGMPAEEIAEETVEELPGWDVDEEAVSV